MKNQKGFTLIELLIVIAVIGILASVILVGLGPIQKQGRDARRISDLRQIQNGLELYYNARGNYPDTGGSWVNFNTQIPTLRSAVPAISNIPDDPSQNNYYKYSSNGSTYCLGAQLEDLNNPNWKRSVPCTGFSGTNCFDGSGAGNPTASNFYCVSL
jgi:prepilin-type N-terminal cleavage/methylation domain-containing protein